MNQVNRIQMACAPIEEIEYFDQEGCKKRIVYAPAVKVVQQPENLNFPMK
jgi:hypothetical protein